MKLKRVLQREVTMGAGNENLKSQILELEQKTLQQQPRNATRQGAPCRDRALGSRQALARLEENVTGYKIA